jgi:hypothetical protein
MSLNQEQAAFVAAALAPRVHALEDLLAAQVQDLPPGNGDWAATADQLDLGRSALIALHNIGAGK